jgi:hypothetical protein
VSTGIPPGSPRSAGTSKDSSARTNRIRIVAKAAGHARRNVICTNTVRNEAPLASAASSSAGSIVRKAALIIRNAIGE